MARRGSGPPPQLQLVLLALAASFCLACATKAQPAAASSLVVDEAGGELQGRQCWYTVQIKTSCASPGRTSDAVSVAFGDAYRNEVYAARLDSPSSGTFERCSTDTFRVGGPCGYGVCYLYPLRHCLYLRRSGRDGWTPQWVRVYEPTADIPATFYYGDPLPNAVWYGFNRCPHLTAAASASAAAL
ncbi:hypothetical protein GUJ93_ZPchr0001g30864 [Zizania palustris]|uniref:Embryo-specific protein 3 n=1 Tax=Zizania palustris TaxID=103762 RepID=A0A8J5RTN5_ZIZPA|nr:hypothetical protein GUJ93_ZPchr0001g30864 [Zizania palustris]